jgi:pimeloyl-ACP methyl ester carboxylesterase
MPTDLQLARECFRMADLAYSEATIEHAGTSTQLIVGGALRDPEAVIVAFRGTKEPRDFLTDARFTRKQGWGNQNQGHVHRGVKWAMLAVMDQLRASLKGVRKVYFTGHSLGGAKAMLAALAFHEMGTNVAGVHTFGAPRVGNGQFRDYYNSEIGGVTLCWEAQGDPIPWLPFLVFNYRSAGRAAYLKNDGRVIVEPTLFDHVPAFIETRARSIEPINQHFYKIFDPHNRPNYARLLKEARA